MVYARLSVGTTVIHSDNHPLRWSFTATVIHCNGRQLQRYNSHPLWRSSTVTAIHCNGHPLRWHGNSNQMVHEQKILPPRSRLLQMAAVRLENNCENSCPKPECALPGTKMGTLGSCAAAVVYCEFLKPLCRMRCSWWNNMRHRTQKKL